MSSILSNNVTVLFLFFGYLVHAYHAPQVHDEVIDEEQRTQPPTKYLRYPPAYQKDQLKWRYYQQQLADAKNLARFYDNLPSSSSGVAPLRRQFPNNNHWIDAGARKLSRRSRNVRAENALDDSLMVETNAHQVRVVPLNALLKREEADRQTIGRGYSEQNAYYSTDVKHSQPAPMPFEKKRNEPSDNNVQQSEVPQFALQPGDSLTQLQAHFDALSRVQVENALAEAHKQAAADVEAQHRAMLLAKSQAEAAALDQIRRAQAEAETLAYIQNQLQTTQEHRQQSELERAQEHDHQHQHKEHETPAIETHVVQQKPLNVKLQNALLHAQKQAQAYRRYTLKTHVPRAETPLRFQEDASGQTNAIRSHGNELQYAASYTFGYEVKDAEHMSNYGHQETRNGDFTKGRYHVLLPDGRVQNVEYTVDPSGYHARVTYKYLGKH